METVAWKRDTGMEWRQWNRMKTGAWNEYSGMEWYGMETHWNRMETVEWNGDSGMERRQWDKMMERWNGVWTDPAFP